MAAISLTALDLGVLALCLLFALRGALRGFAWQIVRLAALAGALWGASAWHGALVPLLTGWFPALTPSSAPFLAWGVVFVALLLLGAWLAHLARGLVDRVELTLPDRLAGLVLGAATGVALATLLLLVGGALLDTFQQRHVLEEALRGSSSPAILARAAETLGPLLPDGARAVWDDARRTVASGP